MSTREDVENEDHTEPFGGTMDAETNDRDSVHDDGNLVDEDEVKVKETWTENDLKEAVRRINAGEIDFKAAANEYGISPRKIHRQRAIENMRAQLNPEKAKKMKPNNPAAPKKDITILRKPIVTGCTSLTDVLNLLNTGTEEVKQLLNNECSLIYECKVCRNLFRSLANFISHKRIYCCDLYSTIHTRFDDNEDRSEETEETKEERLRAKESLKEVTTKPFRVTCRKDITSILKRITSISDMIPSEPILHLQTMEHTPYAFQQILYPEATREILTPSNPQDTEPIEKKETSFDSEPKTNPTSSAEKTQEKHVSSVDKRFVAEKRFRCPICFSNFTIRRSVLRHLKSVHHKSTEQVEKLKSRIQMHFVRMKSGTSETNKEKEKQEDKNAALKNNKTGPDTKDGKGDEWEKHCAYCNRKFVNRNSYSAHMKFCRRSSSSSEDIQNELSPTKSLQLVPVITLTPIQASSYMTKSDGETTSTAKTTVSSAQSKKISPSTAASSKKVALPLVTAVPSNSHSKKIGIQVRMNYCKDNVPATSSNVNGMQYANSPYTPTPSAENSRRNSTISLKEQSTDDVSKQPLHLHSMHSRNTRSGSRLTNILEVLRDKQHRGAGSETLSEKSSDDSEDTDVEKKVEKSVVTIYCDNCHKIYALNEFICDDFPQANVIRNYKCALPNCDFQSRVSHELLPHLASNHAVLSETDLTGMESVFVAEHMKQDRAVTIVCNKVKKTCVSERSEYGCRTRSRDHANGSSSASTSEEKDLSGNRNAKKRKVVSSSEKNAPVRCKVNNELKLTSLPEDILNCLFGQESASVKVVKKEPRESADLKKDNSSKPVPVKRKVNNEVKGTSADDILNCIFGKESVPVKVVKKEERTRDTANARPNDLPDLKKGNKAIKKDILGLPKKKRAITNRHKLLPVNGIVFSSSDDDSDKSHGSSKSRTNYNRVVRKAATDSKVPKILRKINENCFHELSSSSSSASAPDSDIDHSMMSDENLQKSIMTIIFGKEMSAEKVEENVSHREKSPTSSSSSECDKEKRYSFRIAKQSTSISKSSTPTEIKDEKLLKASQQSKTKPPSR